MPNVIIIIYPLLLMAFVFLLLPINLDDYIDDTDIRKSALSVKPLSSRDILQVQLPFVFLFLLCGSVIGYFHHQLIRLSISHSRDILFEHRLLYIDAYPYVPALFLGIIIGAIINFHRCARKGKAFMRKLLFKSEKGVPLYKQVKLFKPLGLWIATLAVCLNMLMYYSFIRVTSNQLVYRNLISTSISQRPVADIEKIFIYKKRVAPIGKIINRKTIELQLKDGTALDTYHLIEQHHHDSFIKAIQKASNNQIQVYHKQLK